MPAILAIDFGTTNTSASYILNQNTFDLSLGRGRLQMRTAALRRNGTTWQVGDEAVEAYLTNPLGDDLFIANFKPHLTVRDRGQTRWLRVEAPSEWVDSPTDKGADRKGGDVKYVLRTESASAGALPGGVSLTDLREATRQVFQQVFRWHQRERRDRIDKVVIGAPVNFALAGRERLLDAAYQAARDCRIPLTRSDIALVLEPIAVALTKQSSGHSRRLIFDHGGGTLDLAVVDTNNPDFTQRFAVLGHTVHERAGSYYDRLLLAGIIRAAGSAGTDFMHRLQISDPLKVNDPRALEVAGQVKERLCTDPTKPARFLFTGTGSYTFSFDVPPSLLDDVLTDELTEISRKIDECLNMAVKNGLPTVGGRPCIEEVIMAGGSSLVPAIQKLVAGRIPDAVCHKDLAGPRTSTAGLATVHLNRDLIDELTDSEYAVYDADAGAMVTIVPFGTPIAQTKAVRQLNQVDGFYVTPTAGELTLVLMEQKAERYAPCRMVQIHAAGAASPVQIVVEFDSDRLGPTINAFDVTTGEELVVTPVTTDPSVMPFVELGQLLRFTDKGGRKSAGEVTEIRQVRLGRKLDMYVGDVAQCAIVLATPDGAHQRYFGSSSQWERYVIDSPLPGAEVEVRPPLDEKPGFVPLKAVPCAPWNRMKLPVAGEAAATVETTLPVDIEITVDDGLTIEEAAVVEKEAVVEDEPTVEDDPPVQGEVESLAPARLPIFVDLDLTLAPAELELQINRHLAGGFAYGGITPILANGGGGAFSLDFIAATRQGLLRLTPSDKPGGVAVSLVRRRTAGPQPASPAELAAQLTALATTASGTLLETITLQIQLNPEAGLETAALLCVFDQNLR